MGRETGRDLEDHASGGGRPIEVDGTAGSERTEGVDDPSPEHAGASTTVPDAPTGVSFHPSSAGKGVGRLIRAKDWSATAMGPMASWPRCLANHVSMLLELRTPAILFWGPERTQLYNDGYAVIMGPRHPKHLGAPFRECWPEAYDAIEPWMQRVTQNGETVEVKRSLIHLTRYGFTEEAYFTFTFSPVWDDHGEIAGVLQLVNDVSDTVFSERRTRVLHELSRHASDARTLEKTLDQAIQVLAKDAADLPFCVLYLFHPADRARLVLSGSSGWPEEANPFPGHIDIEGDSPVDPLGADIRRAVETRESITTGSPMAEFGPLPGGPWPESPHSAVISPIASADRQRVIGVLIAGLSPRLKPDAQYHEFIALVCAHLAAMIGAAGAFEEERKRSEGLAELDRAKTAFFSNVSHEFRTPLTLILGPVEDALAHSPQALAGHKLDLVRRNALRLYKMVNTLLDFSRMEAGKAQAMPVPTDLSGLTGSLAGSFESAAQRAGLKLVVDCPPLPEAAHVDPDMWEKIVLNLLSNAVKYTRHGEIRVALRQEDADIVLSVRDSGVGIPEEALPHIFERFYRVPATQGRSHEGTGIGLALVHELVKLHGGSVTAVSGQGEGTTFAVRIPRGSAHLPLDQADPARGSRAHVVHAAPFVEEERRWSVPGAADGGGLPPDASSTPPLAITHLPTHGAHESGLEPTRGRVLVADDNPDMREYLAGLLSARWRVDAVEDGEAALAAAREDPPDLLLSDVMMPGMDGASLVRALRSDPRTSHIPVVLVSARAGEEAVIDGLETGADDYLVKPFAARELLARVQTHLELARLRREWSAELERANKELEAFSYSVAHDLRAPLRAIDGFSKIVLKNHSADLDEQGRQYLDRIHAAGQQMTQLIDDLIGLSRITRAPMNRERIDVTELARKILKDLVEREPGRASDIRVQEGLVAWADPRLLRVMLENLLGNAWKFTGKESVARIEVRKEDGPSGGPVFLVRDNGAGFNMEHAKKLFTPFHRLHSDSEFEGTGIGLSTVQRVVARHGGRVWAEASPGSGAAFFFTLQE